MRADETDRAEARLQARAASIAVVGQRNACSMAEQAVQESVSINILKATCLYPKLLSLQSSLPEEETFLAQINTRAKVTLTPSTLFWWPYACSPANMRRFKCCGWVLKWSPNLTPK